MCNWIRIPLGLIVLLSAARAFAPADYVPPPDSAGGWRTLTGADAIRKTAGMDLTRLGQAFEFEKETSPEWRLSGRPPWLPGI